MLAVFKLVTNFFGVAGNQVILPTEIVGAMIVMLRADNPNAVILMCIVGGHRLEADSGPGPNETKPAWCNPVGTSCSLQAGKCASAMHNVAKRTVQVDLYSRLLKSK